MKLLFSILAGTLVLTAHAQQRAQVYQITPFVTTNTTPLTNSIQAQSAFFFNQGSTNLSTLPVSDFDIAGISITANGNAASTASGNLAVFVRSFDNGNTFETTALPQNCVPLTLNGTTPVTVCSNLFVQGASHVKLWYFTNASAVAFTNMNLSINLKSPKYGLKWATQ